MIVQISTGRNISDVRIVDRAALVSIGIFGEDFRSIELVDESKSK
jgi:hypothetical protein